MQKTKQKTTKKTRYSYIYGHGTEATFYYQFLQDSLPEQVKLRDINDTFKMDLLTPVLVQVQNHNPKKEVWQ